MYGEQIAARDRYSAWTYSLTIPRDCVKTKSVVLVVKLKVIWVDSWMFPIIRYSSVRVTP